MINKARIIIFSSEQEIVENLNSVLSDNYELVFHSTLESFEKDYRNNYDIAILACDIKMTRKIISGQTNDTSVILLMPSKSGIEITAIEESGSDIYVEIPFSRSEILSSIRHLINEKKQLKQLKQITKVTKESEEKYKRLFQLSPDGMGYYVGGKIGFINDAGIKIFGANSFEEVYGKYFLDFVHPFDREFVFEKTRKLPENQQLSYETRIVTAQGETKYIYMTTSRFLMGGVNAIQFIFRDITEKKLNELNLVESNTRLEFVQKLAKLGYWEYDIKNDKLIWSEDIYGMFGLSKKNFQLTLKNFLNLIHPDDRIFFKKEFNKTLSGNTNLNVEQRIIKHNGLVIYVNQRGTAVYDEKGRVVKFSGSVQDITDRKIMENSLRESQSRLSNIINSAMDAVITVDSDQNIILFNITAEKMFRCSAIEIIGQPLDRLIPVRFREIHRKHIDNFGKTGITMRTMGAINSISGLRADGEEFPMEASISQINVNGQKLFTVIIRDITEKKKAEESLIASEQRYRLLFKKNPMPMWVYDVETFKILDVNFAAVKSYGYSRDEFLSLTIKDIRPEEDVRLLEKYLNTERASYQNAGIWRHIKKDGTIIDVEIVSHEIEFDGRQARLILANDVTEKKRAEDELKNSREQLRQLAGYLQNIREEERSAIAREIHDELGQVLTSLKMNLTFVDKKISKNGERVNISELHNEISGMTSIIDDSVKRIRKIITELRPEMLDQLGLIPALEWQAHEFKSKSGIDCEFINSFGESQVNRNISIAVYRIFQEALTNVMRHSKATKVAVRIERKNNNLELEIADNGIGFKIKANKQKTFGLLGMRERTIILGGDFIVDKNKPAGTKIMINIPLNIS